MNLKIDLPEIETLVEEVRLMRKEFELMKGKLIYQKMWYSREDLAVLKGMKVSSFYNKPWLLPGIPLKQGGRERWSHYQVWDSGWIWKSDEDLRPRRRAAS